MWKIPSEVVTEDFTVSDSISSVLNTGTGHLQQQQICCFCCLNTLHFPPDFHEVAHYLQSHMQSPEQDVSLKSVCFFSLWSCKQSSVSVEGNHTMNKSKWCYHNNLFSVFFFFHFVHDFLTLSTHSKWTFGIRNRVKVLLILHVCSLLNRKYHSAPISMCTYVLML